MTQLSTLLAGYITLSVGILISIGGILVISAGRGGYGMGPLPFIKLPTDWSLIGVGTTILFVGWGVISIGINVL
jgi:hypothetical protein